MKTVRSSSGKPVGRRPRDVFVNCPFDRRYQTLFRLIVFVLMACGYRVRCGLEENDSGTLRFNKLSKLIQECSIGVHDLSRTQSSGRHRLPRFNMPFELGLYIGAKHFGDDKQRGKTVLVFARSRREFMPSISDLAGVDVEYHANDELATARGVRNFLHTTPTGKLLPGEENLVGQYRVFMRQLPQYASSLALTRAESLQYRNFVHIVDWYLIATKKGRGRAR